MLNYLYRFFLVYSWSPDQIWMYDALVQWNGESFRADGLSNVAIPCESTQEAFYVSECTRNYVVLVIIIATGTHSDGMKTTPPCIAVFSFRSAW